MNEYWSEKTITLINFILGFLHRSDFDQINKNKNAVKTISLYQKNSYTDNFSKTRFFDAPYEEVEKTIPKKGLIVDLGCGEGLFTNYLAICSPQRKLIGLDIDKRRIKQADKGLKNVKFISTDVTNTKIPLADIIIMFHLLHHLESFKKQESLIKNATGKLKKKGRLVIVEVKPEISFKYLTVSFVDYFLVPWLFEKRFYSPIFFRKAENWKKLIESQGYKCKMSYITEGTPFPHVILDCTKTN